MDVVEKKGEKVKITNKQRWQLRALLVVRLIPAVGIAAMNYPLLGGAFAIGIIGFHLLRWEIPTKE